ncbi:MAG: NAD(P)H-hydrate epimerase [Gemmatimonadota bacterium]
MYVSTVRQMRDLDRRATSEYGIPDELLMENAGQAVYYMILEQKVVRGGRFLVVSGPGNNGGDGFVVGRKLHSAGGRVRVAVMTDRTAYNGPGARNLSRLKKSRVEILDRPDPEQLAAMVQWSDVVVDGLLGTGLTRDVEGNLAEIVRLINDAPATVFSIDIPSGVDGDSGRAGQCPGTRRCPRGTTLRQPHFVPACADRRRRIPGRPQRAGAGPPAAGRFRADSAVG